ncbi:type I-B CRISPR-associated protein Cas7/Cst2/DevR [Listeria booriae]|uniref:Type I-B CRISPR-associated protein Cas7/Cst2/DevR n=1 Tax=Listeria booriae TaxID=1552123 RepID=A0A841Y4N3_9LIST|nr:type I-B CRISPR-associated protein Cas7/Cst2/DevR [Listeria booriae]MBC1228299.1 type I-B CRISPR-associated protein Cas7/Cst2/DevR [Listeria booriae]MBC1235090.1 type I-B CRISPR-associated protein Cas7/Cst2/DevR [Listeria booriae]MBC1247449.1 type I-B CRISPR-associated protein Cas7/Cst2/DevR [Listeria booriae]MBC1286095.1 type I-B CRISPR-associated protein Cas7/Cst2/DevR [Listeria booriae]MBC1308155.1 type I-B CRISPR-associated protein Cas7/Cst2/DevR [Listeria booriae]
MKSKGLAMTIIFQAESANYGESLGNISALKKISRNNGDQYTYISRQAIRYNMMEQVGENPAPVKAEGSGDKKVIQFLSEATITDYPELDFFGYLKTEKGTQGQKRSAKVRLSNAISLETFKADLDFLTNKGQADKVGENMNIAQAEIHRSYYRYTVTIDLDQIGIDGQVEIDNKEKSRRVQKLMDTIALLYRDIRGRREDLKPLFVVGGVYDVKNPVFQNVVDIKDNKILVDNILGVIDYPGIKENTKCGVIDGKFDNTSEIKTELHAESVPAFFKDLKEKIDAYYESN